ncbi:ribonuclease H [Trifolium pratense]|uniref:Ribonuclease H n=1 Tax=Trifolium pratense TaxID=57577 RepID=A0A2K3JVD9_TRIPR|nr:ribonuclease H [Trifolium pratense]
MLECCTTVFNSQLLESARASNPRSVAWSRPTEGTFCLNVDGSFLGSTQTAGFGGLIRNNAGAFLGGFYGVASMPSILYAEIMAVLHGLELCWNNGYTNLVCFSDSLQAVSLIKNGVSPYHTYANEIHKIRQLIGRDWNVSIDHTLREGNACADFLAKLGASSKSSLVILEAPPSDMSRLLLADAGGMMFVRG